jgi:hypothetical protein
MMIYLLFKNLLDFSWSLNHILLWSRHLKSVQFLFLFFEAHLQTEPDKLFGTPEVKLTGIGSA